MRCGQPRSSFRGMSKLPHFRGLYRNNAMEISYSLRHASNKLKHRTKRRQSAFFDANRRTY